MTTAILTLGPKEQPNGSIKVTILSNLTPPPIDFFLVEDPRTGKQYKVHLSQLSNIVSIET